MKLHDLRAPEGAHKERKRVGRGPGSGYGKTAGRGTKGQKSRSGGSVPARFQGGQTPIQQQLPYKRGFTNIWSIRYHIVNLAQLNAIEADSQVTPESLLAAGLVRDLDRDVKILGDGQIAKPLYVTAHKVSESARQKIEAASGSVTLIDEPKAPRRARGRSEAPVRAYEARRNRNS